MLVKRTILAGALGASLLVPRVAAAGDDPKALARSHYDSGTGATMRGDYASAAAEFAEADRLLPSPVALEAALDAAIHADDAPLGMELAQRASRGAAEGQLSSLVAEARARFSKRTGRVRIACAPATCTATVDGIAIASGSERYVRVGAHVIRVAIGARTEERAVTVEARSLHDLVFDAVAREPPPAPKTEPPRDPPPRVPDAPARAAPSGISPVWVVPGASVTVLFAAATVASALRTSAKHDHYFTSGCDRIYADGCLQAATDGQSAQRWTNVLLGVSSALGAATLAVAIFAVNWRREPVAVAFSAGGGGARAFLRVPLP